MSEGEPDSKKRKLSPNKSKKQYYKQAFKGQGKQHEVLQKDMRGFLVTTSGKDVPARRESILLLEDVAGSLRQPEPAEGDTEHHPKGQDSTNELQAHESESGFKKDHAPIVSESGSSPNPGSNVDAVTDVHARDSDSDPDDIEAALKSECQDLSTPRGNHEQKGGFGNWRGFRNRFWGIPTNVRNVLFVKDNLDTTTARPVDCPQNMCHCLYSEIEKTGSLNSRHIQRLIPVDGSADARLGLYASVALASTLLHQYAIDQPPPVTFAIQYKARNYTDRKLDRETVITAMADAVKDVFPMVKVSFDNPDLTLLVNVLQNVVCLGLARNYEQFCKGNLRAIADKQHQNAAAKKAGDRKGQNDHQNATQPDESASETGQNENGNTNPKSTADVANVVKVDPVDACAHEESKVKNDD